MIWETRRAVAPSRYHQMMEDEAKRRDIPLKAVLAKFSRKGSRARFSVWRELKLMGYSYPGIARIKGYNHTSVIHGIRIIDLEEPLAVDINIVFARPPIQGLIGELVTHADGRSLAA